MPKIGTASRCLASSGGIRMWKFTTMRLEAGGVTPVRTECCRTAEEGVVNSDLMGSGASLENVGSWESQIILGKGNTVHRAPRPECRQNVWRMVKAST